MYLSRFSGTCLLNWSKLRCISSLKCLSRMCRIEVVCHKVVRSSLGHDKTDAIGEPHPIAALFKVQISNMIPKFKVQMFHEEGLCNVDPAL